MRVLQTVFAAFLAASAMSHAQVPIGANLGGVSDWSRTNEFADLVKQSRTFGTPGTPWDENAPLDADGWPTGDAGVVLMCCQPTGSGLEGVYRISFDCQGVTATTPSISLVATTGTLRNIVRDVANRRVTAEFVMPAGGTQLMLAFTGTNGGLRNLKVMRPGTADGDVLSPAFLAHNRRFGALRFMDWLLTNDNETTTWSQRTRVEQATWRRGSGVPYEICALVCNQLDRDMWICVPAKADDAYVRAMARTIRDHLAPHLHVYVEYSNEVWNWQFRQAQWNHQQAVAEVQAGNSSLSFDGNTDENIIRWRRHARETVRVGRLFAEEFGAGSMLTRVRPVLAAQIVWSEQYRVSLEYIAAVHGTPSELIYALAGAPYFNMGGLDQQRTDLSTNEVLGALEASVRQWQDSVYHERLAAYTQWYHLAPFMGYEGGPDTFGPNNIAAKRAANHDPRIRPILEKYLNDWYAAGGGLFQYFVSGAGDWNTQYGAWSLTETMLDQNTAKIQAVDAVARGARPALTLGFNPAGTLEARRHVERGDTWQNSPTPGLQRSGDYREYLLRTAAAGRYELRIEAASWDAQAGVNLSVNGADQGRLLFATTGSWNNTNYRWSASAYINLPAGQSVLRTTHLADWRTDIRTIWVGCPADFNADGGIDGSDIEAFFAVWESGEPAADVNGDGGVDGGDLEWFLVRWEAGGC